MKSIAWTIDRSGMLSADYFPIHDARIDEITATTSSINIKATRKDLHEICFLVASGVPNFRLSLQRRDIVSRVFVKPVQEYSFSGEPDEILKSIYVNYSDQEIWSALHRDCPAGGHFSVLIVCNMGGLLGFLAEGITLSMAKLS